MLTCGVVVAAFAAGEPCHVNVYVYCPALEPQEPIVDLDTQVESSCVIPTPPTQTPLLALLSISRFSYDWPLLLTIVFRCLNALPSSSRSGSSSCTSPIVSALPMMNTTIADPTSIGRTCSRDYCQSHDKCIVLEPRECCIWAIKDFSRRWFLIMRKSNRSDC